MLVAARDARVGRFIYAASSSTYGDHPGLPKVEDRIGVPLSPYAVTKYVNELYAGAFSRTYGTEVIGLRYFNVFGPRQNPDGMYAAVIPKWIGNLMRGRPCVINGDGKTSRDFCYIDNAVQANLLAATVPDDRALGQVYNVAYGTSTTLDELYALLRENLMRSKPDLSWLAGLEPVNAPFRPGDVRHALADISKAIHMLGYAPTHSVDKGLSETVGWYAANLGAGEAK
jgi:UDP-N-acetylglucosamine 4-epimerase